MPEVLVHLPVVELYTNNWLLSGVAIATSDRAEAGIAIFADPLKLTPAIVLAV
jgi:hypothetical protein